MSIVVDPQRQMIDHARFLSVKQVLQIFPTSRQNLHRFTMIKDENQRIPSYRVGGRRYYKYDELIWWMEKHRFEP